MKKKPLMLVVDLSLYERVFFWFGLVLAVYALSLSEFLAASVIYLCLGVLLFFVVYKDGNLKEAAWKAAKEDDYYSDMLQKVEKMNLGDDPSDHRLAAEELLAVSIILSCFISLVVTYPRFLWLSQNFGGN